MCFGYCAIANSPADRRPSADVVGILSYGMIHLCITNKCHCFDVEPKIIKGRFKGTHRHTYNQFCITSVITSRLYICYYYTNK